VQNSSVSHLFFWAFSKYFVTALTQTDAFPLPLPAPFNLHQALFYKTFLQGNLSCTLLCLSSN